MLDELTLLADKSLVIAEDTSGATRYRLLETVRQYALEKLNFKLIARSKSKMTYEARRGGTECGAGES